jgi:hypothetical protein
MLVYSPFRELRWLLACEIELSHYESFKLYIMLLCVCDAVLINTPWINKNKFKEMRGISIQTSHYCYFIEEVKKTLMFMMMNLLANIFQSRQVVKLVNVIFVADM